MTFEKLTPAPFENPDGTLVIAASRPHAVAHLQRDDPEEDEAGDVDLFADEHECAAAELAEQVDDDEEVSEDDAARPRQRDVLALLAPLQPHAQAVLDERADEAEARHVRQHVLAVPQQLHNRRRRRSTRGRDRDAGEQAKRTPQTRWCQPGMTSRRRLTTADHPGGIDALWMVSCGQSSWSKTRFSLVIALTWFNLIVIWSPTVNIPNLHCARLATTPAKLNPDQSESDLPS